MLVNFFLEDRIKIFNFFNEDIFLNFSFFSNFYEFINIYEYKIEFFHQKFNYCFYILMDKFFLFYKNFFMTINHNINLVQELPEMIFLFYQRLIDFLLVKIEMYTHIFLLDKLSYKFREEIFLEFLAKEDLSFFFNIINGKDNSHEKIYI